MRLTSHASQESLEYLWENPYCARISMGISHAIHIFYIIFNGKIMEYPMQAMFLIFRGSWEDEFVNLTQEAMTQKELDVARRMNIFFRYQKTHHGLKLAIVQ